MKKKIDVSVVVATHKGKNKIPLLINSLKKNKYLPREIIICGTHIDDKKLLKKKDIKLLNINFIISKIRNQSEQRKKALKKVKQNYILQVDDDVILEKNFFKYLNIHITNKNKKKIIMSLVLIDGLREQAYRWNMYFRSNLFFRILLMFFNYGKKIEYMSILPSGRICPLLPKNFVNKKNTLKNMQWTNSLICYHKSALRFSNINYKTKEHEKSFYEDVIFSHNLYKKGYQLQLDPKLKANHPFFDQLNFKTHLKTLKTQFFIVREFNKNYIMFVLDLILATIFLLFRK